MVSCSCSRATLIGIVLICLLQSECVRGDSAAEGRPNLVLIFTDDQGWGDVGCFGATDIRTPNLDRLATEGRRFTDFYVAQAVCTASRAALLSGCYPNRISMSGALNHTSTAGIHPDEWLLPEMLKDRGYATAIFGKWHLGTAADFHPLRHGFDAFFGIPYSNDNSKYHPVLSAEMPPLPLYDGVNVAEMDPDQSQFTRRLTERAAAFIEDHRNGPFCVYLAHVMPHVPIFASADFRGKSPRGVYGDVIEELDWSVGRILDTLRKLQLDEQTLVIFLSDNGPFLSYGDHAGSAGPLREGKLTTFEGGVRSPCLMRWAGKIPAGTVCAEPAITMDLLPTLAELIGGRLPEKLIDGRNIASLMFGDPEARSPHDLLCFYAGDELQAVRSGEWKLHFAHDYLTVRGEPGRGGKPSKSDGLKPASISQSGIHGIASRHGYSVARLERSLFHLPSDPGEQKNVAEQHPEVVTRLSGLAERLRRELGDALTGTLGTAIRAAGNAAK